MVVHVHDRLALIAARRGLQDAALNGRHAAGYSRTAQAIPSRFGSSVRGGCGGGAIAAPLQAAVSVSERASGAEEPRAARHAVPLQQRLGCSRRAAAARIGQERAALHRV